MKLPCEKQKICLMDLIADKSRKLEDRLNRKNLN